ncbi:glycosyltransferase family 4 protein [Methanoculleus sp. Wushi-C6]|uniref:Glycosyltransferase family 4 protein n=2 Tax=Methanoculleus caldifontis TaxID=2651577 RepID=A0ABU3WZG7_9EURY|nr:glycosyltransferase family 4 protein [Methanoculleus sp. Wushi-C6]
MRETETNLLAITHTYRTFQKDPLESIAPYFSNVYVCIRSNPAMEILKHVNRNKYYKNSLDYKIDLSNKPENCHIYPSPTLYVPIESCYKSVGRKHLTAVTRIIKRNNLRFQLIHAHFTWSAGYVGACLKEEYDTPFVVTAHGYDIYSLPFRDADWKSRIEHVLNTADAITTVSNSNRECIERLNVATPVFVIPNGYNEAIFYPKDSAGCRRSLGLPLDKKIILSVGNFSPIKGHKYLISAVKEVAKHQNDILCIIIGSGQTFQSLERQIKSEQLEQYVRLVDRKPHGELSLWMNACDIFVLPSVRESFGLVQIEAMACGKPVVATRNGGSEEIIVSQDCGLLVEPKNSHELAEQINTALNKKWEFQKILEYSHAFSLEEIAKGYMKVYEKIL